MFIVRPAHLNDHSDLYELAVAMAPGITTFPPDKSVVLEKIKSSIKAFDSAPNTQLARNFLLVLEDVSNNKVIGTAGVYSEIGHDKPFYSFQKLSQTQQNSEYKLKTTSTTLNLVNAFQGGTEVGTLLLHPDYAGLGLGKVLAKSRYLLISCFPELFKAPIFAELRGWTDENGLSPFWEAVGKHFFADLDFTKADLLSATTDNQFIADMMPKHPIYLDLLPKSVQEITGKPHNKGRAALKMLLDEGFRDEGLIDIFDSGITVKAHFNDLTTIAQSAEYIVSSGYEGEVSENEAYIATTNLSTFNVIKTNEFSINSNSILLPTNTVMQLQLLEGQTVRLYIAN